MSGADPFAVLSELFPEVADIVAPRRRGRGAKSLAIEQAAAQILEEIHPATVRAVCYRLFVKKLIAGMKKSCTDSVSRILVRAREEGTVPWEHVVDETRRVEQSPSWPESARDPQARQHGAAPLAAKGSRPACTRGAAMTVARFLKVLPERSTRVAIGARNPASSSVPIAPPQPHD